MRILMLTQFFHPIVGGIESHVLSLCRQLVERGHEVAVATMWQEGLLEFQTIDGIRIFRLRSAAHYLPKGVFADRSRVYPLPLPDPFLMRGLKWVTEQERPHIVHAHNSFIYSYLPLKLSRQILVIETLHDYHLCCPKWTMVHKRQACTGPRIGKCVGCCIDHFGVVKGTVTRLGSHLSGMFEQRGVDLFLPVSESVAERSGLGQFNVPYKVVPNFVRDDVTQVREDVSQYTAQLPKEDYIIFVGAFGRHKGLDVLLSAYEGMTTPLPLVLIGYEVAETRHLLKNLPRNVQVFFNWPNHAVIASLRRSMFVVIPSICPDACPTVAIEALACGCPMVASDIGGIPDIVAREVTGLLCPPGNPTTLRNMMQRMIEEKDLRRSMRENAVHRVMQFYASHVVGEIEECYIEVVQRQAEKRSTTGSVRRWK